MAVVADLRKKNNQIMTSINLTTQHYINVEAENSILRAQAMELSQRLDSLNEIRWVLSLMGSVAGGFCAGGSWFEVGRMVV